MRKPIIFVSVVALFAAVASIVGGAAATTSADPPTITSVTPSSGYAGQNVVINGTALSGATVSFKLKKPGAQAVTVTSQNTLVNPTGTQITVVVPDGGPTANSLLVSPGKYGVWVTTPGGTVVWNMAFVVKYLHPTKPVIAAFKPLQARPGTTVRISGSHLNGAMLVTLGGMKAAFKVPSDKLIIATVPKNAHSGRWGVKTPTGTVLSSGQLHVEPAS